MFTDWLQWARRHPRTVDVVVAVLLWAFAVFSSTLTDARIVRAPTLTFSLAAAVPPPSCSSATADIRARWWW